MSTITIIEGNNNDKDNIRVLMVKGEAGATISTIAKTSTSGLTDTYTVTLSDGRTQTFTVTNGKSITTIEKTGTSGLVDTYTITFNDSTTQTFTVTNGKDGVDGVSPTATVSKTNTVTTISITDKNGTTTAQINDAVGYEIPTGGVIGWNTTKVSYTCDGTETGGYYLVSNTLSYYFTMPSVEAGDLLIFDPTDELLTLNGETIVTTSSGTGTELTFVDYIPAGYEDTGDTMATITNSYSTSTEDGYSCNYINNLQTYSTTEKRIGAWIDGKPLYMKTINFGALPNNTSKSVAHNIQNLKRIWKLEGFAGSSTNIGGIPLPYAVSSPVALYGDDTEVTVVTTNDRTAYTQTYIYIWYTKTTD